jgi:hypothetical protein
MIHRIPRMRSKKEEIRMRKRRKRKCRRSRILMNNFLEMHRFPLMKKRRIKVIYNMCKESIGNNRRVEAILVDFTLNLIQVRRYFLVLMLNKKNITINKEIRFRIRIKVLKKRIRKSNIRGITLLM